MHYGTTSVGPFPSLLFCSITHQCLLPISLCGAHDAACQSQQVALNGNVRGAFALTSSSGDLGNGSPSAVIADVRPLPYALQAPKHASELTAAATSGSSAALSRILTATCCWRHVPSRTYRNSTAAASTDTTMRLQIATVTNGRSVWDGKLAR